MEVSGGHLANSSCGPVISLHVTLREQLGIPTRLTSLTKYWQLKGLVGSLTGKVISQTVTHYQIMG